MSRTAAHQASWCNDKHRAQWTATLDTYAHPVIGSRPVAEVDTAAVTRILEPIWREKPETAFRLRGRIEQVLDYAAARGWRMGDYPARWRAHLANLLPTRGKVAALVHHPALPWTQVGASGVHAHPPVPRCRLLRVAAGDLGRGRPISTLARWRQWTEGASKRSTGTMPTAARSAARGAAA